MIIRPEQMRELDKSMNGAFETRALAHLRQTFPQFAASMGHQRLLELIRRGTIAACGFGVKIETDVLRYLEFEVLYGTGFDTKFDAAQRILLREDIDGTRKMDRLDDWEMFSRPVRSRSEMLL